MRKIKRLGQTFFRKFGIDVNHFYKRDAIYSGEFKSFYDQVKDFTMTSPERLYSVYNSVKYIVDNKIPGDFIECGVWRGGSSMMVALTLSSLNEHSRKIYLYDTFEGMPEPGKQDTIIGKKDFDVTRFWKKQKKSNHNSWCFASLEDVKNNLKMVNYPYENINYLKGDVLNTIPNTKHKEIALLRLDTDWYDSSYHELKHLYPLLANNGILIIDDYGHWAGAKKAVDQYFEEIGVRPLLQRVDYTCRCVIKTF